MAANDTLVPDPEALRQEADRLRDAGAWAAAATRYAAYMALRPDDRGMLVQQGHCVKEAGEPAAALLLYAEAARRDPADPDIHLQIGHALKLLGRLPEARAAYGAAVLRAPRDDAAWREYVALADTPEAAAASAVALDLSDLMAWFGRRRAPSGIQRVQLGVLAAAAAMTPPPLLLAMAPEDNAWRELPWPIAARLAALSADGADAEAAAWRETTALAAAALRASPPAELPGGAVVFNPGTAWAFPGHFAALRAARRRGALRYVTLLHDCGPLVVPEHCPPGLPSAYASWFSAACVLHDGFLANSAATQADATRFAALVGSAPPPIATVPLAAADAVAAAPRRLPLPRDGHPFVLFVGTLEARKNHLLVFSAWLTLLRRHGPERVPRLVCVGRVGPGAEPALTLLAGSALLAGRATLLSGIDDATLAALYDGCLFTLYNSHHEGWGLPVSESIAHGKVPVVPEHSALREAGAGAAVFFAANDEPDLVAKLERLILDPGFRAAAEARVAAAPRPRPWAAAGADLLAAAIALPPRAASAPAVRLGTALRLGRGATALPSAALALAELAREGEGWAGQEAWGCPTRPGGARLRLPLAEPAPPGLVLRVALRGVAPAATVRLRQGDAVSAELALAADAEGTLTLPVPPGALCAEADVETDVDAPVGVTALMVCGDSDLPAWLDWLEARLLRRLVS